MSRHIRICGYDNGQCQCSTCVKDSLGCCYEVEIEGQEKGCTEYCPYYIPDPPKVKKEAVADETDDSQKYIK